MGPGRAEGTRALIAIAVIGVAGVVGLELVAHGVLPGQQRLDQIDGECSLPGTPLQFSHLGASMSGRFHSHSGTSMVASWA